MEIEHKPEFVWVRGLRGEVWPQKHVEYYPDYCQKGVDSHTGRPIFGNMFDRVVARFALQPNEVMLSLNELTLRYPLKR